MPRSMVAMTTQTMTGHPYALTLIAVLGSGLAAGVFFAFSSFVMDGLRRACRSAVGAEAMQAINRTAVTPLFMTVLFGTALVCVVGDRPRAVALGRPHGDAPAGRRACVYLVGAIVLTMARNVPLNDALAALARTAPRRRAAGAATSTDWTAWNHVRTVASLAACGLFAAALAS